MIRRLVYSVTVLGLVVSPALADIAVTLEPGGGLTGLIYADIPIQDAIVAFGLDAPSQNPAMTLTSFTAGPLFAQPASTPDGDGIAGLVLSGAVYGEHVLLGTLTYDGDPAGGWVDLGVTPGDLTEGLALPGFGFAAATFSGAYIPEPAALALLAIGAFALRRR
ncbi:MAG: PEP-CTERM sorting domain-containing protein [Phycisphaerae bacterium]|jgi:hypothetical protein|nr:PEP-CTERM sorting domain-containing protein [Phycisphaerae bacterium]